MVILVIMYVVRVTVVFSLSFLVFMVCACSSRLVTLRHAGIMQQLVPKHILLWVVTSLVLCGGSLLPASSLSPFPLPLQLETWFTPTTLTTTATTPSTTTMATTTTTAIIISEECMELCLFFFHRHKCLDVLLDSFCPFFVH